MSFVRDVRAEQNDSECVPRDLFDEFFELYAAKVETDECQEHPRVLRAIVGSSASPVGLAILRNANLLNLAEIDVRVVFGQLSPVAITAHWFDTNSHFRLVQPSDNFKVLQNPGLLDAHEQMVLGNSMSWCGDAIRRRPSPRDCIDIFEDDCEISARLARLSFDKLWDSAGSVSSTKLKLFEKALAGYDVTDFGEEDDWCSDFSAGDLFH